MPSQHRSGAGGPVPGDRAASRSPAAQGRGRRRRAPGPPPVPRGRPRVLTRQSAAAASIARVPLPPLQDEVGVGPLGDPQRVGQQHLFWVHPHVPGRRGRTHNGRRVSFCTHRRARARTPGQTRARPPARCGSRKRLQQPAARAAPATTKPPRAAGDDGEDAGTASCILSAALPPPASPRPQTPRPAAPQPGRGSRRREEREEEGSGRRRKWCGPG